MKARYYVLIFLVSVCCLSFIGFGSWMRPYNLAAERAAARAEGIPLTSAELQRVQPPTGQNAVPAYLALEKTLEARPLDDTKIWVDTHDVSGTVPRRTTALMSSLLKSRKDVGRLVETAVARPHAFIAHSDDYVGRAHFLSAMREATRWIRWESIVLARSGMPLEAVRRQAMGFRIANQAAEDPDLLTCLVGLALENMTLEGLTDILCEAGPNAGVADAVSDAVREYHPRYDLTMCLKGEVAGSLADLHQVRSMKDYNALTDPSELWKPSGRAAPPFIRWYILDPSEAIYLHWMTAWVRVSKEPLLSQTADLQSLQAQFAKTPENMPTYRLAKAMTPVFGLASEQVIDAMGHRAAVTAMAKVLEQCARQGRWPATIEDAASPAPLDPRTGKPVGYRHDGAGFVITITPARSDLDSERADMARKRSEFHYPPLKAKPHTPTIAPPPFPAPTVH